jgi:hypothetical protein
MEVIDIDEFAIDTCMVLYDPDLAREQLTKMSAQQHTQATMDARSTLEAPPQHSAAHPPEWKGCKNIYCVRKCGQDGKHLREDGSPGGRGACRMRAPPPAYCPPSGQPTFEEAKCVKNKRKREDSPSYEDQGLWSEDELRQGGAAQAQVAAQQAETQQAATQAAQQAATQAAQPATAQPSEMEILRIAVQRLQQDNARLSSEVNSLKEWKERMFAAFIPPSN